MISTRPQIASDKSCALGRTSSCLVRNLVQSEKIDRLKKVKSVKANTVLWAEGQRPAIVGFVMEGVLRITQTTKDGRQQILGLHMPSDFFGHLFSDSSACGLEAAGDAQLCTFDRADFEQLIDANPALKHAVLLATLDQLNAARDFAALLGAHHTSERIARFFLACSRLERADEVREVNVPIGRRDLAALLNTTPETICRFVKDMVRKRILSIRSANSFAVLAVAQLEEVAGKSLGDGISAGHVPVPTRSPVSVAQNRTLQLKSKTDIKLARSGRVIEDLKQIIGSAESPVFICPSNNKNVIH